MLDTLLGSKTRSRLLSVLFAEPDRGYHVRELIRLVGAGSSGVQREIGRLQGLGIVCSERDARGRRVISLAKDSPFLQPLAGLVAAQERASHGAVGVLDAPPAHALHPSVRELATDIVETCRRFGVLRASVFGSATDAAGPTPSDLDVAVTFSAGDQRSRADLYFGLRDAHERVAGMQADLVELDAVDNPYMRDEIARTEVGLYETA